ncbi:MAG: DUF2163 domain-containing protein [Bacteroidales bacterium]|nr:DUF2163 domain-containing protein [Bacteroidales bacterium]
MAEKTQNGTFHPSEVSAIRMAVIEHRLTDGHEWKIWLIEYNAHGTTEKWLRGRCEELSRRYTEEEWRFRFGILTLDPSDKCETFKSE